MIFIGELINGTRKKVKEAVLGRDVEFIKRCAIAQSEAGADYLDINAGTGPERETRDLLWLIDTVQSVVNTPICIDSSNPSAIRAALDMVKAMPLVNSINGDPRRLDAFLPVIKDKGCAVIALALDESKSGMPKTVAERMKVLKTIFASTRDIGIGDDKVFVDPLIMAIATDQNAGNVVLECIRTIKQTYPDAHITGGLSNISFGLPKRTLVNRTFLTLAMAAGLDSAVVDPTNSDLIEALYATELLLGKDRFCRKYTTASKIDYSKKK